MMLHKIFHMNQSVDETKRRLANVSGYRHHLDGVEQADVSDEGVSHWRLQLPLGFRADFVLNMVPSDEANTLIFKSVDGDFEIMGMVTFNAIKSNLTEVDLAINYESSSPLFNLLDKMLNVGDHFIVNQLRRVRAHFEGIAAPVPRTVSMFENEFKPLAA